MLKKGLSQHLIRDKNITGKIVRMADITKDDTVVEVGAGYGDLTKSIAEKAGYVYAIEVDGDLISHLEELAESLGNVSVVHNDFLRVALSQFTRDGSIKVVGNIPYKITAPIIFKLLEERKMLSGGYLTMQDEVARRIVSKPFNRTYSAISVVCQILCNVKILFTLKPSVFVPPPKVDSVLLSMVPKEDKKNVDAELLAFVRACFQNKRKYLKYAFSRTYSGDVVERIYSFMQFRDSIRAEEISPGQFEEMYNLVARIGENS